jgi:spermidine synthase
MTTLAVELTAGRLLGNIFGTSNLVWASIIGLILIYLTVGYFLGGWWADRSPHSQTAFLIGLVPLVANPVLRTAADAFDQLEIGILLGAFAGVLVLFSVPITLLGTVSPFAIRLAIRTPEEAGRVSGRVYAISTLGSFVGTFLPVLILIPTIGTTMTFIVFSFFLMLVALIGLWLSQGWKKAIRWAWMPIVILLLVIFGMGRGVKATQGQIFETESQYNYIQVLEDDNYRYLRLNEGQGIHSAYHPSELNYYGPWKQFLVAPFFNQPSVTIGDIRRIAIVGLAGGTTARQATEVFGPIPIDGFEIDGQIISVGEQYFGMNQPNLNALAQDGRWGLEHSSGQYDLIALDAYRPPYIPWHLATREYFQIVYNRLTDDGTIAINVGRAPDDRRLIDALVVTLKEVFPSVYVMDVPETFNSIIYATKQPTSEENLFANLFEMTEDSEVHPLLIEAMKIAALNLMPVPETGVLFTDDLAPIEWITNNMVLRFMLFGDMEILQ